MTCNSKHADLRNHFVLSIEKNKILWLKNCLFHCTPTFLTE